MITLSIERKELRPYETVTGRVEWRLDAAPKDLELRLCWFTRGRGTEESETVEALPLGEPWSVDGPLIGIAWALEVVAKKQGGLALEELVVSPDRKERKLGEVTDPRSAGKAAKWLKRFTPRPK